MNKLQKILNDFEEDWGCFKLRCTKYLPNGQKLSAGWITEKDVKKYIQIACVEYARSIVNTKDLELWDAPEHCEEVAFEKCREEILYRIDQDLLLLKEK